MGAEHCGIGWDPPREELVCKAAAARKARGKKFIRGIHFFPVLAEFNGCRLLRSQSHGEKKEKALCRCY